jgi:predicted dehydrogenase
MTTSLRWGILAASRIAGEFVKGLKDSRTGTALAVGSRMKDKADSFGAAHGIPHRYGSYEALLADPDVDVVYISTPHSYHAEWAIKAAEAGKHILCEKPLTLNLQEAEAVVAAAKQHNVFLMEAFKYRCHPQTARAMQLIREKAIGDVRLIQATFSFHAGFSAGSRLFNNELGGGGILDVGCYCTSFARLAAGAALGIPYADPLRVVGCAKLNEITGTDDYSSAVLEFPGSILAQVTTGVAVQMENTVRIFGTEGWMHIVEPWLPGRDRGPGIIMLHRQGEEPREIAVPHDRLLFAYEADVVAAHLHEREAPEMPTGDSLGNMATLDRWRAAVGLVYPAER